MARRFRRCNRHCIRSFHCADDESSRGQTDRSTAHRSRRRFARKLGGRSQSRSARRADELVACFCEFDQMVRELRDKEKLRQTFGLRVGRLAAERILARDPGLSGVEEEITVMFVDMRSWTARASASPPAEIAEITNDFFRVNVRAVEEEHRGIVNKYLGDGFMAIFVAADSGSNHACDAVSAGFEILRAVKGLNDELGAKKWAAIQIGIGIHPSPAIVGSVGSPQRLEFTAISNTVNVTSRIQGLTKTVGRPCSSRKPCANAQQIRSCTRNCRRRKSAGSRGT